VRGAKELSPFARFACAFRTFRSFGSVAARCGVGGGALRKRNAKKHQETQFKIYF
jgi:hypothetical protein